MHGNTNINCPNLIYVCDLRLSRRDESLLRLGSSTHLYPHFLNFFVKFEVEFVIRYQHRMLSSTGDFRENRRRRCRAFQMSVTESKFTRVE